MSQEAVAGETLTVDGNLSLDAGAALTWDIYSLTVHDSLTVFGNFTMGRTREVELDANAPLPQLGDVYDVFDFNTASGRFQSLKLPALAVGLAWNVSHLLATGELEYVVDVDYNDDGNVGGSDLLSLQRNDASLLSSREAEYGS